MAAEIIPGYFIHTPDEKFGPYANIMEADTAAEKLMSEGVQVLGITKEGFEGVVSYEALEYNAESWPASARFCDTCGSDEPYYDYVKCDCGTVNCDACRCGDCGGCHQSAHCHYNTECASCGKHYRSQTCEYCESFSADSRRHGGLPKCEKCNHRYGDGTCPACGNILCQRCHGDSEWCKSCQAAAESFSAESFAADFEPIFRMGKTYFSALGYMTVVKKTPETITFAESNGKEHQMKLEDDQWGEMVKLTNDGMVRIHAQHLKKAESFRRPKLGSSYGRGDWEDPDCISCGLPPTKFPVNVNGVRFELIDGLCPNCIFKRFSADTRYNRNGVQVEVSENDGWDRLYLTYKGKVAVLSREPRDIPDSLMGWLATKKKIEYLWGETAYDNLTEVSTDFKRQVDDGSWKYQRREDIPNWYYAESKIPPAEKAGITGITSGATMEGLETLLAADGYKGIPASKIEILKWYVRNGGKAGDFHDLPTDVQIRLQMGKVHELLFQDVNRWLQDHGHNPHMETPDWLSAESFAANPQGRPYCEPCAERGFTYYGVKTCGDCGYILCKRCFGDGEICKSCGDVECENCGDMESPDWIFTTPHGEFCVDCRSAWIEDPDAYKALYSAEGFVYFYTIDEDGFGDHYDTLEEAQAAVAAASKPMEIHERREDIHEPYKMDKRMGAESFNADWSFIMENKKPYALESDEEPNLQYINNLTVWCKENPLYDDFQQGFIDLDEVDVWRNYYRIAFVSSVGDDITAKQAKDFKNYLEKYVMKNKPPHYELSIYLPSGPIENYAIYRAESFSAEDQYVECDDPSCDEKILIEESFGYGGLDYCEDCYDSMLLDERQGLSLDETDCVSCGYSIHPADVRQGLDEDGLCENCAGTPPAEWDSNAESFEAEKLPPVEDAEYYAETEELAEVRTELSKSRTDMSLIRTGLAIAGFILLWEHHKWAKEEHDIKETTV